MRKEGLVEIEKAKISFHRGQNLPEEEIFPLIEKLGSIFQTPTYSRVIRREDNTVDLISLKLDPELTFSTEKVEELRKQMKSFTNLECTAMFSLRQ